MALTIITHPFRKEVSIKTNLSPFAIIAYTERICKIKGWSDTMVNRARAKIILDAIMVIEYQRKKFAPIDFEGLYDEMEEQTKYN